jgi:hypothetical protein
VRSVRIASAPSNERRGNRSGTTLSYPAQYPSRRAPTDEGLQKVPELTLDRTVWLLRSALPESHLSEERAILLLDYYINRKRIARASHEKNMAGEARKGSRMTCCGNTG